MADYTSVSTIDQFVASGGSKTIADALGKAYELSGRVQVKVDWGGGTKFYFGLVTLSNNETKRIPDGAYLLKENNKYTKVISDADFTALYTVVP